MTNQHPTSNEPTTSIVDGHNVIAVSFDDDREAYHALTLLKELDSQQRVGVQEAVVVVRGEDGQLVEKDGTESPELVGTASGGLMGLLLGSSADPSGCLSAGRPGDWSARRYDLADYEETDSALARSQARSQGRSHRVSSTVVRAVPTSSTRRCQASAARSASIRRRRRGRDRGGGGGRAQSQARSRKELMRSRHEHDKATVNAKVDALKSRFTAATAPPRSAPERAPDLSRLEHRSSIPSRERQRGREITHGARRTAPPRDYASTCACTRPAAIASTSARDRARSDRRRSRRRPRSHGRTPPRNRGRRRSWSSRRIQHGRGPVSRAQPGVEGQVGRPHSWDVGRDLRVPQLTHVQIARLEVFEAKRLAAPIRGRRCRPTASDAVP